MQCMLASVSTRDEFVLGFPYLDFLPMLLYLPLKHQNLYSSQCAKTFRGRCVR